jgi:hypothetical protein
MRKVLALIGVAASVFLTLRYLNSLSETESRAASLTQNDPLSREVEKLARLVTRKKPTRSPAEANESANSDQILSKQAHQTGEAHLTTKTGISIQEILSQRDPAVIETENLDRQHNGNAPSIGTIKVLGHRGCDANTQGWFLSVGTPEQYNFTVSDDGETVEVEPNTPNLTGNFEFIHCADQREFIGKQVQLTVAIKAQGVTDTAQLRLRGENPQREAVLYQETKVGGTYDWRDFSVQALVGSDVTLFSYGLTFRSAGKLWFSHPVFNVIP